MGKEELQEGKDVKFDFTKKEYDYICEEAMLSEIERDVLEDKIKGKTIVEISFSRNISTATISRIIKKIKKKIYKVI